MTPAETLVASIPRPKGNWIAKDNSKDSVRMNLSNMEERLQYIERLNERMLDQIDDTEMVSHRDRICYCQNTSWRYFIQNFRKTFTLMFGFMNVSLSLYR